MNLKPDYIYGDMHLGEGGMFNRVYNKTFETVEQYEQELVKRWNKTIKSNDTIVFLLGDLGRKEAVARVLPQLRGQKYLIMGNHDKVKSFYTPFFVEVFDAPVFAGRRCVISHHPIPVEPGVVNIHGHTHNVFLESEQHFNACPEHYGYTPLNFKKLELKLIGNLPKPDRRFLHEWYKDIQKTEPREDLVLNEQGIIQVKATIEHRAKLDKTE